MLIANRVFIAGDDSYLLDPAACMRSADSLEGYHIGVDTGQRHRADRVRVGKAAVVSAHAVVAKDIPPPRTCDAMALEHV